MNIKLMYQLIIILLLITCFFLWNKPSETSSNKSSALPTSAALKPAVTLSQNYLKIFAGLSSAISSTGEVIVLNNLTGQRIKPCKDDNFILYEDDLHTDNKKLLTKKDSLENKGCGIKIINPSPILHSVIEASNSTLKGIIRKDGKDLAVTFKVMLISSYKGSICNTHIVGGIQRTFCPNEADFCQAMYASAQATISDSEELAKVEDALESFGCGTIQS